MRVLVEGRDRRDEWGKVECACLVIPYSLIAQMGVFLHEGHGQIV